MYFYLLALIIAFLTFVKMYFKCTNKYFKSEQRLDGKTCVVTGGTNGMGLEIAKEFARRGARVIVACPFENEGIDAQKIIIKETGNDQVIYKHLDLASFQSVRDFADDILRTETRIDILMNNAGITAEQKITEDCFNTTMQINYYGHFLLTNLLMPLLIKTGTPTNKVRIVNTTSLYHSKGSYTPGCMDKIDDLSMGQLYGSSKLYLLLFATELTRRLKGHNVVINTVDPGAVGTTTFKRYSGRIHGGLITIVLRLLVKTPWAGAQTALHVALDEKLGDISGQYFKNCELSTALPISYDKKAAQMLWDESVRLVKLHGINQLYSDTL